MATKVTVEERDEAIRRLREMIKPGDTVYTVLRHVSHSGMRRSISPVIIRNGEPVDVSYWVRRACGYTFDKTNGGLIVEGAGMDMGFGLVYNLARRLYDMDAKPDTLNHKWI